jgi:hypothetical protein
MVSQPKTLTPWNRAMRRKPNCFLLHLVVFLLLIPGLLTESKLFAQEIYDSQKETIPKMKPE